MDKIQQLGSAISASKAPAIARAAAILRLLGRNEAPMGLQPIARELGLVPSTCLYVLRALAEEELVSFDPTTKQYGLGAGVLTLARNWLQHDPFPRLAQPLLDDLTREFDMTTIGVEIVGLDHIVAVVVSQGAGNFRLSTQVGSRFPALISATGRCIAAFGGYSEELLKARFDRLRWDNPPGYAQWHEQVDETRAQGYALDDGNYIEGIAVLAAPVWRRAGRPSHALVALGTKSAARARVLADLGRALRRDADKLSAIFGRHEE